MTMKEKIKASVCTFEPPRRSRGGVPHLLRALTAFISLVLKGNTAPFGCPFFFGASLFTLEKTGGGVRPIAVGSTLHHLMSKCAGNRIMEAMGALLAPY